MEPVTLAYPAPGSALSPAPTDSVVKRGSREEVQYAKGSSSSGPWDLFSDPVASNHEGRGHLLPEGTSVPRLAGFPAFLTDRAQPSVRAFLKRSLS